MGLHMASGAVGECLGLQPGLVHVPIAQQPEKAMAGLGEEDLCHFLVFSQLNSVED